MKLSVIIPAYNCADTIGQQLDALMRQEWDAPWEVIVADNGSTDDTRAVVERYQGKLPGLRFVDASQRSGAGHARNRGAEEASGDVFLFCDADDEVAEGWVTALGNALREVDFVASAHEPFKLSDPEVAKMRWCPQQKELQEYKYPPFLPHAGGCGLGIKRFAHEAVGGFDESFYKLQDTDYCWRVQLAGFKLHFVPDALIHVRFRNDATATYKQMRQWGEYNVKIYKKFRPLGMPRLPMRRGIRTWLGIVKRLPLLAVKERRTRYLLYVHGRLGRAIGSIKYRVFAL